MSEEDVNLKITKLVEAINADPYDFQNYIHLIELYRQNGMLEEVREARQRAHQLYCLPVNMW